ncbi:MtnX-like HAD-IB family phosphatase [Alkalicoccus urumqiensis]|uniref:MtnX-like HAD-IB family phosphatase n=1 Tax=Alkalicoccus urumqiensis TaxID=1548213 RepID=UPI0015E62B2F|nr:MtnX-like HAD-IB family phosphatase [Alkalicoccus urumqiensis]
MADYAFITDFDGTLTREDFYWMVIHTCWPEGEKEYHHWQNGGMQDVDFLTKAFLQMKNRPAPLEQWVKEIPYDETAIPFLKKLEAEGIPWYIVSAGADVYIQLFCEMHGLHPEAVYANRAEFRDQQIQLFQDPDAPFYSERYGIDKKLAVRAAASFHKKTCYFGDSGPDALAAGETDLLFARDRLPDILKAEGKSFHEADTFEEAGAALKEKGWPLD